MIPACPAPLDPVPPKIATPPDACDTHAHVFGPADQFPYGPDRSYTPPDAPLEKYLHMLDTLGFARGGLVQGSAHGRDNSAMLDALARHPKRLRGVAVADETVPKDLPDTIAILKEIGLPVVIDHMGRTDARAGIGTPGFQSLVRLVGDGGCWVKMSGAHRLSTRAPDYPDARPFHEALVRANPDRLIWGTDWPHPRIEGDMPNAGHLLDLFNDWTPDMAVRRKILVDNPATLYGF
jgi:predicted TIM-barrel fold metal-dependent hydrolase